MDDSGAMSAASEDLDALFLQLESRLAGENLSIPNGDTPVQAPIAMPAGPSDGADRRHAPRIGPDEVGRSVKLTVRGAAEAQPINLSETGVLAETTSRLLPGTTVELLLQIDGVRHLLRATIVRSVVHSLSPRPIFRTAFRFEEPTKLPERH